MTSDVTICDGTMILYEDDDTRITTDVNETGRTYEVWSKRITLHVKADSDAAAAWREGKSSAHTALA